MLTEFSQFTAKAAAVTMTGITSIFLATIPTDAAQIDVWLKALREFGSFALIVAFVGGCIWGAQKMVPKSLEFLTNFLTTTRDGFLNELRLEREARERSVTDFREMLGAHKSDLKLKLDEVKEVLQEGNGYVQQLAEAMEGRPCVIVKNDDGHIPAARRPGPEGVAK